MNNLFKKAIAEFIGTFVLVFAACGVAAVTGGNIVPTAFAFGLVIVAMAYTIGRVSGCHINPAVSLACLLDKRMTLKEFFVYIAAQILGGFIGGVLIFGIAKMANFSLGGDACNYYIAYKGTVDAGKIIATLLLETVLTCIFVFVILTVTDKEGPSKKAPIIIGLVLTLVHFVGIPLDGTSVNPARSLATALSTAIFNQKVEALAEVWVFIVGPLLGGLLAYLLYHFFLAKKK